VDARDQTVRLRYLDHGRPRAVGGSPAFARGAGGGGQGRARRNKVKWPEWWEVFE